MSVFNESVGPIRSPIEILNHQKPRTDAILALSSNDYEGVIGWKRSPHD